MYNNARVSDTNKDIIVLVLATKKHVILYGQYDIMYACSPSSEKPVLYNPFVRLLFRVYMYATHCEIFTVISMSIHLFKK